MKHCRIVAVALFVMRLNSREHWRDPQPGEACNLYLFRVLLEENKEKLGLGFYSVSPSTFDEVFLRVIEKHNVGEEDTPMRKSWWRRKIEAALRRRRAT